MPKMVMCEPNPDFKPGNDKAAKDAFATVKKKGPFKTSYQTALQNMQLSGGMYRIKEDTTNKAPAPAGPNLRDMPINDLKVMMVGLGVKTEKQMTRDQIIGLIEKKLGDIEVVDE